MKKRKFILLGILLISVCAFAQAPDWQWATQAGGTFTDRGYGIAIDDAGNSYVTGNFEETATFGSYFLTSSGYWDSDIFVAKMDADGNWLWATQAGGPGWDRGNGITIDDSGNSYVTGNFEGTATFGSYSLTSSGCYDIFIAKIDAVGNWQWATKAGGIDNDRGNGIAIDDIGNYYVTGYFQNTATFGSYSITSSGGYDIFVAKMDADGNWLWATQAGGIDYDVGNAITIDDVGNSYVTGDFGETATFGSYFLTSSLGVNFYVAKVDANGNWQWATQAGETSTGRGYGIAIDDEWNTYVTGYFYDIATFGSYSITSSGNMDIYVARVDADGNWLWATRAGGIVYDRGFGITIDDAGNIYVTGVFEGTANFGSYSLTSSGSRDIFVAKLYSSVFAENEIIPTEIGLSNFPNPFNPETTIYFTTEHTESTEIIIYNIKGQKVKILECGESLSTIADGVGYSISWDGTDENNQPVSSGIYFYQLKNNGKTLKTKKMLLLK